MIRLTILPSQERDDNEVAEEENKAGSFIRMGLLEGRFGCDSAGYDMLGEMLSLWTLLSKLILLSS